MYVRWSQGRRERITIGQFPVVSLSKAREEVRKLAAQKTLGLIAPKAELLYPDALEELLQVSSALSLAALSMISCGSIDGHLGRFHTGFSFGAGGVRPRRPLAGRRRAGVT
jgi:hypothetical protein